MVGAAQADKNWLPASWLYFGLGMIRAWVKLSNGDRFIVVLLTLLGVAIPIRLISVTAAFIANTAPAWLGISLGALSFLCIGLTLTLGLANVRRGRLFQFLGETNARKRLRIGVELALVCGASAILLVAAWPLLQGQATVRAFTQAIFVAAFSHSVVAVFQFLSINTSPSRLNPTGFTGLNQRSRFAFIVSGSIFAKLPPTSSRFLLKANTNPLVWLIIILTLLSTGGAAISLKSPLLALSTISTVLMIIQLTLLEPRVGNGRTIGASAKRMPIHRAVSDLCALALPHLACFAVAVPLMILDANSLSFGIGLSQLAATIWIIWMSLLVRALPPMIFVKSVRWLVALAIIVSQIMPPLIIGLMIIATFLSTRDLIRLSQQGPAQWPV